MQTDFPVPDPWLQRMDQSLRSPFLSSSINLAKYSPALAQTTHAAGTDPRRGCSARTQVRGRRLPAVLSLPAGPGTLEHPGDRPLPVETTGRLCPLGSRRGGPATPQLRALPQRSLAPRGWGGKQRGSRGPALGRLQAPSHFSQFLHQETVLPVPGFPPPPSPLGQRSPPRHLSWHPPSLKRSLSPALPPTPARHGSRHLPLARG